VSITTRLAVAFLAWTSLASASSPVLAQNGAPRLTTTRLRDHVHLLSDGVNGNVLVVEGDEATLLIDAQTASRAAALDSAVRRLTTRPVRLVVNTHYHEDHVGGNLLFRRRGAEVMAHEKVIFEASKDTVIPEWENWHRVPLPSEALPTRTVSRTHTLRWGKDSIELVYLPSSHSGTDLVVWNPRANVMHTGDVVEVGTAPFIDWWTGGSIEGTVRGVVWIINRVNDSTLIVPGHGPVTRRSELFQYGRMLEWINLRVRHGIKRGETDDQIANGAMLKSFEQALGGPESAKDFVKLLRIGQRIRN
jgi:glyoxylase-like metal-dependent hydrolase (beta-lactamase superfamily II)